MKTLPCFPQHSIQVWYTTAKWFSIFSGIATSLLSIHDYRYPDHPRLDYLAEDLWVFLSTAAVSTILTTTIYLFQSRKIGEAANTQIHPPRFSYDLAPRTRWSNFFEIVYFSFSIILLLANNYLMMAGAKAQWQSFQNPQKIYPILPLYEIGWFLLIVKVSLFDLPFNATSSYYEVAERIKKRVTGSKVKPWLSLLIKPFAQGKRYDWTLGWIKIGGLFSHVVTNYLNLLVVLPPQFYINLYKHYKIAMICTFIPVTTFFCLFAAVRAFYFQAKESERHLKDLNKVQWHSYRHSLIPPPKEQPGPQRRLLMHFPGLKPTIRNGLVAHSPIQGFSDTMPAVFFMRDFAIRMAMTPQLQLYILTPIAAFLLLGSAIGTFFSDVLAAFDYYDRDFSDIQPRSNNADADSEAATESRYRCCCA